MDLIDNSSDKELSGWSHLQSWSQQVDVQEDASIQWHSQDLGLQLVLFNSSVGDMSSAINAPSAWLPTWMGWRDENVQTSRSSARLSAKCTWFGQSQHRYRLRREWVENDNGEKILKMLVDVQLNMRQPCALTAQKLCVLGCIPRSVGRRARKHPSLLEGVSAYSNGVGMRWSFRCLSTKTIPWFSVSVWLILSNSLASDILIYLLAL